MTNAASTAGDRVQLLVLVDAADALARYCVLSIHQTLFAAPALIGGRDVSGCTDHPHIDFIGAAGAEQETLAAWLDRKRRRGAAVLTAA
jgi:hypothetical protein